MDINVEINATASKCTPHTCRYETVPEIEKGRGQAKGAEPTETDGHNGDDDGDNGLEVHDKEKDEHRHEDDGGYCRKYSNLNLPSIFSDLSKRWSFHVESLNEFHNYFKFGIDWGSSMLLRRIV